MHGDGQEASEIRLTGSRERRWGEDISRLRLAERREARNGVGLLASGAEIACDLREVEHPEGRFRHADGTRYDICVMEVRTHPNLRAPAIPRANFVGDCADNRPGVIRLGNVRQSSFRLCLIAPGDALGTLAVEGKSTARLGE